MYLIYLDESGNSGLNLNDSAQPVFVLAALIVSESTWHYLEQDLLALIEQYFPAPRPKDFEIHATDIRNGTGFFRRFPVAHRLAFRDECIRLAYSHETKLIYRAILKKRFAKWTNDNFGSGIAINPHVAAFPLVARVVNEFLHTLPGQPNGILISDENKEIVADVEKTIAALRGINSGLRLDRIIEKGFFIDSSKSLVLQLCDLCAYHARKMEEKKEGFPVKSMDESGIDGIENLIHRGNESLQDTLQWLISEQQKKERPGEVPGSV